MDPAIDGGQHRAQRVGNLPGVGCGVVIGEQVAHRGFGRLAAMGAARDAIGHHREHAFDGRQLCIRLDKAPVVFVSLTRPGGGGVAKFKGQRHSGR